MDDAILVHESRIDNVLFESHWPHRFLVGPSGYCKPVTVSRVLCNSFDTHAEQNLAESQACETPHPTTPPSGSVGGSTHLIHMHPPRECIFFAPSNNISSKETDKQHMWN